MGLDSVELVMEFEETFGVELKDQEVVNIYTPRMVGDLIYSKLKATEEGVCQSQRAFYMLRKAFLEMFAVERKSITPDMRFRYLIPKSQEKEVWERLRAAISARSWPSLVLHLRMSRLLIAVGLAIVCMSIFVTIFISLLGFVGGIVIAFVFLWITNKLTPPYRNCISSQFTTIRDLVPYAITSDNMTWTREQVSSRVKHIVMEQLGVKESNYTEDSRFVEDFGMD
ncbi:MAG: hypothetical protein JXM79_09325 [Sedimentisphaerales bacterium]|nr:hypothetical protein [Sedimentisphaerales bacterium]